jgi:DSHCT (NUC185) domain
MREDLKKMKRVLRRLGYTSPEGVLGTKGRFSCELSTPDELVLTDMVFDGVFNDLKVEQAVALVSCFVFKEGEKMNVFPIGLFYSAILDLRYAVLDCTTVEEGISIPASFHVISTYPTKH